MLWSYLIANAGGSEVEGAKMLPNGHYLLSIGQGLDTKLNPDWVWNKFDHMDVNRHPLSFPCPPRCSASSAVTPSRSPTATLNMICVA